MKARYPALTLFGKRRARGYVCNACRRPFAAGEWGRMTSPNAYRHAYGCPGGDA